MKESMHADLQHSCQREVTPSKNSIDLWKTIYMELLNMNVFISMCG